MTLSRKSDNRIIWLDLAKAFGILTIMASHTFGSFVLETGLSFAVPLFFLISGITFKHGKDMHDFRMRMVKSAKRLLIPALCTYILMRLIDFISCLVTGNDFILALSAVNPVRIILSAFFSRCDDIYIGSVTVHQVGILWFFPALFVARLIYDLYEMYLGKITLPMIVAVTCIVGVLLGHYRIPLPLSADCAMAMLPFIYIGKLIGPKLKSINKAGKLSSALLMLTSSFIIFCVSLAIVHVFSGGHLSVASGVYPMFPLCFITAFFGSLCAIAVSIILEKIPALTGPLSFVGRNSLYLLCIHYLDSCYRVLFMSFNSLIIAFVIRLTIDIALLYIVTLFNNFIHNKSGK